MENNTEQPKKLYRSRADRIFFGVCGGLGEYFGIDPIIFRLIFVILVCGGGSGILIYIILAFLMPVVPEEYKPDTSKVDIKGRAEGLASEFKETINRHFPHEGRPRSMGPHIFFGLLFIIIGFLFLAQNLDLMPGYYFDLSVLFKFWPVLIILAGLSLISRGIRRRQLKRKEFNNEASVKSDL